MITAFCVCVGYDDYLAVTLARNSKELPFVVITSAEDRRAMRVAEKYGADVFISPDLSSGKFPKGRALNEALDYYSPDWALTTDADIILPEGIGSMLDAWPLNEKRLYFTERWTSVGYHHLKDVVRALKAGAQPTEIRKRFSAVELSQRYPWGYFQFFAPAFGKRYPEVSDDFAWDDSTFANEVYGKKRCAALPPELSVMHLHHGDLQTNWKGRKSPRLEWVLAQPSEDLAKLSGADYVCVRPCFFRGRQWRVGERVQSLNGDVPTHFELVRVE